MAFLECRRSLFAVDWVRKIESYSPGVPERTFKILGKRRAEKLAGAGACIFGGTTRHFGNGFGLPYLSCWRGVGERAQRASEVPRLSDAAA